MKWSSVKELKEVSLINEYEKRTSYKFDEDFKKCIIENNGGYPEKDCFETENGIEMSFERLLSFNHDDLSTVWLALEWDGEGIPDKYVPFADDGFGNLICFDKASDKIIFLDHDDESVQVIADNFKEFIDKLYKDDDDEEDDDDEDFMKLLELE